MTASRQDHQPDPAADDAASAVPIQNVPTVPHEHLRSTWKQARPGRIRASFDVAQSQDPGGWYVVGRSGDVGTSRSVTRMIAGREIVLWRDEDGA